MLSMRSLATATGTVPVAGDEEDEDDGNVPAFLAGDGLATLRSWP